jgi:hypothetical protein
MKKTIIPQKYKDQYIGAVLGGQTRVTILGIEITWKAIPSREKLGGKERERLANEMAERDLAIVFE